MPLQSSSVTASPLKQGKPTGEVWSLFDRRAVCVVFRAEDACKDFVEEADDLLEEAFMDFAAPFAGFALRLSGCAVAYS